jgi:hypothetical protein
MKTYDQISSLFWLLLSISVCIESIRLGTGTLRHPDMGFMAFGVSALLGILSLTLFLRAILKKEEAKIEPFFSGKLWKRVLFVLIAILIYSQLMPVVGYLISTFLLMSFLFWIVKGQNWWRVLILSFLTTLITYYVFSVWLKCQFPEGLFGL